MIAAPDQHADRTAVWHAAAEARDARFDGVFYTGVTSTGIYCRCVCPARMPKRANRRYFPSAAAAESIARVPNRISIPAAPPRTQSMRPRIPPASCRRSIGLIR